MDSRFQRGVEFIYQGVGLISSGWVGDRSGGEGSLAVHSLVNPTPWG